MSPNYLTQEDVQNYGTDLVDFAQRAAAHAIGPELQALNQQNAELGRELAIERRKRLDQQLEQAIPNFREIDSDPRWLAWLRGIHELSGQPRQTWLNDAIAHGDAQRVIAFFRGFLQEHALEGGRTPSRRAPAVRDDGNKLYTREQIKHLYDLHQKGRLTGAEWERVEAEIIRAGAQGRVIGAVDPAGR